MDCSVKFYVLPVETLNALYKCQKIDKAFYFPAAAPRLAFAVKFLSPKEKTFLKNLNVWKAVQSIKTDSGLKDHSSDLKTVMTEWVDYQIPRTDNKEERNELFSLKKQYHSPLLLEQRKFVFGQGFVSEDFHSAKIRSESDTTKRSVQKKHLSHLKLSGNGRFTLRYLAGKKLLTATISPGQMSFLNSLKGVFWTDQMEVITIFLSSNFKQFFLSELRVLDMYWTRDKNILKFPWSTEFYLGYKTYLVDETKPKVGINYLLGWAQVYLVTLWRGGNGL